MIDAQSIGRFLLSGRFWLGLGKILMLLFIAFMIVIQIPELRYDMLGDRPVIIDSPSDLDPRLLRGTSYARITGTASFEYGFNYERYGLMYTYFTIEPYGLQIVARGYDLNPADFTENMVLAGKLRPFDSQPFSYVIRDIFHDQNDVYPPEDAFSFGLGDVPAANGWQIGSIIFALVLFLVMFYFFFLFRRKNKTREWLHNPLHGMMPEQSGKEEAS